MDNDPRWFVKHQYIRILMQNLQISCFRFQIHGPWRWYSHLNTITDTHHPRRGSDWFCVYFYTSGFDPALRFPAGVHFFLPAEQSIQTLSHVLMGDLKYKLVNFHGFQSFCGRWSSGLADRNACFLTVLIYSALMNAPGQVSKEKQNVNTKNDMCARGCVREMSVSHLSLES